MNIEERTHLGGSAADLPITYGDVVCPWHCDRTEHMNAMAYARFDEASRQLLSLFGLTTCYFRKHNRFIATVQLETTFNRELRQVPWPRSGCASWKMRENALRVYQEMHVETKETVAVSTSAEAHPDGTTREPCPLPPEIQRRSPDEGTTAILRALEFGLPGQW